jgi:hypothetical protein
MAWRAENLEPDALGVSASRRTDIPALFGEWFVKRLDAGFVESIPPGPRRRVRHSLRPEHVTHFTFWSKWPRPFFRAQERVLHLGYPVLWNVTLTGLGGTDVEPGVPRPQRAVEAVRELSRQVGPEAVLWRYDHRVAISFVMPYRRQVLPDLRAWAAETDDARTDERPLALAAELDEIARDVGIPLSVCCDAELRRRLGRAQSGCNAFAWAQRACPALAPRTPPAARPTRPDCGCSREIDIGVYDTCVLGCRYSYGSRNRCVARQNFARHAPDGACLLP